MSLNSFIPQIWSNELLVALRILQEGRIARDKMVSSWAGAMGQPQFMPSNYFDYAVDFAGAGPPDIWTNVPDVLASIANYLHKDGWTPVLPWGFEVVLPKDPSAADLALQPADLSALAGVAPQ